MEATESRDAKMDSDYVSHYDIALDGFRMMSPEEARMLDAGWDFREARVAFARRHGCPIPRYGSVDHLRTLSPEELVAWLAKDEWPQS